MRRLFSTKGKRGKKGRFRLKKYIPHICIISAGVILIAGGVWWLLSDHLEDIAAEDEYDELRAIFFTPPEITTTPPAAEQPPDDVNDNNEDDYDYDEDDYDGDEPEEVVLLSMEELARRNPDFIGWITIRNQMDYPVVRGSDNVRYLNTTFSGQRNSAGAIFMDYRNYGGFDDTITILYGHRTRRGTMFGPVARYLDNSFLQANSTIKITTKSGTELTYKVFAAKLTNAWDSAYTDSFSNSAAAIAAFPGAPAGAGKFLLLSTCTPSDNDDERILVFATLQ